jgi:hypothetical protein
MTVLESEAWRLGGVWEGLIGDLTRSSSGSDHALGVHRIRCILLLLRFYSTWSYTEDIHLYLSVHMAESTHSLKRVNRLKGAL